MITLHTTAWKCSQFLGRNLFQFFFLLFLGTFSRDIWFGPGRGSSHGRVGVQGDLWCLWAHLGHHWVRTDTRAVKHSRREVESLHPTYSSINPSASLVLRRYRNMGNLLKVLTCTDLEQEPNFFLDFESESFSCN